MFYNHEREMALKKIKKPSWLAFLFTPMFLAVHDLWGGFIVYTLLAFTLPNLLIIPCLYYTFVGNRRAFKHSELRPEEFTNRHLHWKKAVLLSVLLVVSTFTLDVFHRWYINVPVVEAVGIIKEDQGVQEMFGPIENESIGISVPYGESRYYNSSLGPAFSWLNTLFFQGTKELRIYKFIGKDVYYFSIMVNGQDVKSITLKEWHGSYQRVIK